MIHDSKLDSFKAIYNGHYVHPLENCQGFFIIMDPEVTAQVSSCWNFSFKFLLFTEMINGFNTKTVLAYLVSLKIVN